MNFLPPSSFTFKMAFGNGTALMLKPKRRKIKIHHCTDMAYVCVCQLLGMLAQSSCNNVG